MSEPEPTVFLVDDDGPVLRALARLLGAAGYAVRPYQSPEAFLAEHDGAVPGCAVLDLSMPGIDGLAIQAALAAGPVFRPVIFLTGAGDIPTSVRAMKAGAVDFLTKPVDRDALFAAVGQAIAADREARRAQGGLAATRARVASLTPREREVLALVVAGRLNKQIAHALGTSVKTVKVHRGRMMAKMGVHTVADLVRAAGAAAIAAPTERAVTAVQPPSSSQEDRLPPPAAVREPR
jgi:FixJ family two-component response regulator